MSLMKKIVKWLDINLEPIFIMFVFFVMLTLIVVQVFLRFTIGSGFAWGEEFSKFMFVWLCFIGISYASRNNRQISVDFLRNCFSGKIQKCIILFVEIFTLILLLVFFKGAVGNVLSIAKYGEKANSMAITMNVLYFSAVVGYLLTIIRLIQSIIWKINRLNASYTLFFNEEGKYSGSNNICFMPKAYKEEADVLLNSDVMKEEELKLYKKNEEGGYH